jgi:hypothetical protein
MYEIELHEPTEEFARCWSAAGGHLNKIADYPVQGWLKIDLVPPFLEHLSFRLGNQLFYVRIVGADEYLEVPGNPTGVLNVAKGCNGHACIMPMRRLGTEWVTDAPGWGLLDARTFEPIDPVAMLTEEKVEMTDWEFHDFGVQVVRTHIVEELGFELMSSQGNPEVDPSIWFVGENGPEWVVVRTVKFPEEEGNPPENIKDITQYCSDLGVAGHFASVALANSNQAEVKEGEKTLPIWRGSSMSVRFKGLVSTALH